MAGKEKRRYINYRVDAYLRDKFLQSGRKHKPREICGSGESLMRCFNTVKFCVVCCASLSQAVAPWMLCAVEVLAVLLIFFLATPRSLVIHHHRFSFTHSLEDVVGISCTRAAILSMAYAVGQRTVHRPYLYAAYFLAAACLPYILVKTVLFKYGMDSIATAAILTIAGMCSVFHVLAARRTVEWARRRYQMGLAGFGMPWEEGEDAWLALRRPDLEDMTKTSDGGGPDAAEDVPAEMLADDDSKFMELSPGVKVHYKEVAPPAMTCSAGAWSVLGGPEGATTGIVLVHGFGGGVFSWRHIKETLAMQCHCRVIAFDRPAFGLTSRPRVSDQSNPYTVASQSQLLLQLCSALGLRQVVFVAHADGCLVTLRAAATSASYFQHRDPYVQPLPMTVSGHLSHELGPQYLSPATVSAATRAPERSRTAPASADSSPKYNSSSPSSPTSDQLQQYASQQAGSAGQQGGTMAQAAASGGGALSAAAFAAAVAAGDVVAGPSHGSSLMGPGSGGGSPPEWESGRGVVAAREFARPSGSTHRINTTIGFPAPAGSQQQHGSGPGTLSAHHHSTPHHHHPHHQPYTHHHHSLPRSQCCAVTSGCVALSPPSDVEAGGGRCDITLDSDRASVAGSSTTATALSTQAHHRRAQSVPGPVGAPGNSSVRSEGWETSTSCGSGGGGVFGWPHPMPHVLGLVLLHPNLSGVMGPAFSRILARSKLGRSILRPLLRTEVGEVANRRAWHNTDKLTSEVMELYKTPLRVEGWDAALIETTRQRRESCQGDLPVYCSSVQHIPSLVITGEHDRIVPPVKSEALVMDLPYAHLSVLQDCGHLSHEEAPSALLEQLVPFCGQVLCRPSPPPSAPFTRTC